MRSAMLVPAWIRQLINRFHSDRYWLMGWILLVGLAWLLRAPLHTMPLERDEGVYATIATRWLAGAMLYRDLFDHKPPLTYLVYLLAVRLPGDPVVAVRMLATCYLLATGVLLLLLARKLYGPLAALAAVASFLAYGSSWRFQGLTFNTEAVLLLPSTLGCLLASRALLRGAPGGLFWAGLCVGLAGMVKPQGLAPLAALLLAPLLARWSIQRVLVGVGLSLLGAVLPLAVFLALVRAQGAWDPMWVALVDYNLLYAADGLALGWNPRWMWRIWKPMLVLDLPALAGLILATFWGRRCAQEAEKALAAAAWRAAHLTGGLWGLLLLAMALLSLRDYPHYYLAAVAQLSLWAGAGIAVLAGLCARILRRASLKPLLALAATLALLAPVLRELAPLWRLEPRQQISLLYGRDGAEFFAPASAVAGYVTTHVPPDAPIFVWAAEPQIYYLARRRPAARFVYDYPLHRMTALRDELLATLLAAPPPLIITYHDVRPIGFHPFDVNYGYRLRATIGGYDIWQR